MKTWSPSPLTAATCFKLTAEKRISFNFRGRYYQLGTPSHNTKNLWFVFHGQGHLAQYFIKKFESLKDEKTVVIAPEGLSRYYLDGFYGKVGATWMTKEDRLNDIQNYLTYLNAVYQEVMQQCDSNQVHITCLGFSQGAATVSRWVIQDKIQLNRLILWGGIFPFDMDFEKGGDKLSSVKVYAVVGDKDPYFTEERRIEQLDYEKQLGIEAKKIVFDGAHEIPEQVLKPFI